MFRTTVHRRRDKYTNVSGNEWELGIVLNYELSQIRLQVKFQCKNRQNYKITLLWRDLKNHVTRHFYLFLGRISKILEKNLLLPVFTYGFTLWRGKCCQINVVIKKLSKMTHIHSVNCDVHKIFWVEVEFLKNMKKLLFPNGKSGIALWLYHEFGFLLWFSDWVITFYMIMHFLRELCSNNQRTENIWSTKNSSNWIVFLLIQTNEHYNTLLRVLSDLQNLNS